MFHQSHSTIFGPTFFVIVSHNVLVIGVRVLCEETLDKFSTFICSELEDNVEVIHIAEIHSDGMLCFKLNALKNHELIFVKGRTSYFVGSIETEDQQINN